MKKYYETKAINIFLGLGPFAKTDRKRIVLNVIIKEFIQSETSKN